MKDFNNTQNTNYGNENFETQSQSGWDNSNANNYAENNYQQGNGYTSNSNQNNYCYNNYNQSYNSNYNGNNQSLYNSNYNGADNDNQNQKNYVEPGYPYEYEYKFFSAYFNYKVPENPYTVCITPKMSKSLLILIAAPFAIMPVVAVLLIVFALLFSIFPDISDAINFIVELLPVMATLHFALLVLNVAISPIIESHLHKRHCHTKVKGIIKAVGYINPYKESSGCVPLCNFFYQGKEYYFEGRESLLKKYEAGTEVEIFVNENDPTECYVANDKHSNRLTIILILVIVAIAFFIGSTILKWLILVLNIYNTKSISIK